MSGFGECPFGGVEGFGSTGKVATDTSTTSISTSRQAAQPIDLLLDTDGDLVLTSGLEFSTGINAVAQGIRIRIQTFKGEWFLDLDHGVPYYQDLLGQKFNEIKARAAFREAILSAPGVDELTELEVSFDAQNRELTVSWEVTTSFGIIEETLVLES